MSRILIVAACAVFALVGVGPGTAAAQSSEDEPPVVTNGKALPGSLPYLGGTVTISADATDDVGVTSVGATMYGSDGGFQSVELIHTSGTSYSATVAFGPNYTDSSVSYSLEIMAMDANGGSTIEFFSGVDIDAQPQFDEAPIVSDPSVAPRDLPAAGGSVTIQASASDNRGISEVYATVTLPDGSTASVALEPNSSSRFEGVYTVPANTKATAVQYGIEIIALDDIGQPGTADAGKVTVAAKPAQVTGRLSIWPGSLSFGRVQIGRRWWQPIVVRNIGPKSSAPVEGVIRASGQPFAIVGAGPQGIRFRLRAGEARIYLVEFRPTIVGPQAGTVSIVRADGGQPGLTVGATGRGVGRR